MKIPVPPSPKKRLGQNFLVDQNVINKILDYIQLSPSDQVLEVGAGTGALTARVAPMVSRLVAVEMDKDLIPYLEAIPGVKIIHSDIRKVQPQMLVVGDQKLRVIGNLPYYISTSVLTYLIEQRKWLHDLNLMFQEEVTARILATPSTPEYGYLTVIAQYFCEIEKGFRITRNCFYPRPEIESRVLRFRFRAERAVEFADLSKFLARAFSQRRKKLRKNIQANVESIDSAFRSMGLDDNVRAENLSPVQFEQLILLLHP